MFSHAFYKTDRSYFFAVLVSLFVLVGCAESEPEITESVSGAPGAPGAEPYWVYAGKIGIGTSYEAYLDGQFSNQHPETGTVSKVWFSLADGGLTETMFGLIHEAQIRDMQLVVVGDGFVDIDTVDTESSISYLVTDASDRPLAPAYRIFSRDYEGKYELEKHYFTDPSSQTLMMRVQIRSEEALQAYAVINPHMNNDGWGDTARADAGLLQAQDAGTFMSIKGSQPFLATSVGFLGASDGVTDLEDGVLDWAYANTGEQAGNVVLTAKLFDLSVAGSGAIDLVAGFGYSQVDSATAADATLKRGYQAVLDEYVGVGEQTGWQDYLASLDALPQLQEISTDNGALANASALVLKTQEDKTHAGALIASLSNPWGDTVSAAEGATGYKAVWPRDFYQCAMAFLAMGDTETPLVAFEYLKQVQVSESTPGNSGDGGWFLQKTHVDGTPEWVAVQLDQTAMPIMLGWQLWHQSVLTDEEAIYWYNAMLGDAAHFLVDGGDLELGWAEPELRPPYTQQERWEEQSGYSPSTMAATIAGLVSAADLAELSGDMDAATKFMAAADDYSDQLEALTYTSTGLFQEGEYYLRITPEGDPNDPKALEDRNGRGPVDAKSILDGGFLELVRYGVRAADIEQIRNTLAALDDQTLPEELRVKYEFEFEGEEGVFPGWRRYGHDGYGEDKVTGGNYGEAGSDGGEGGGMSPNQRGRVWPFFTGERAHYELAAGVDTETLRRTYIRGMELFANEGLMLPEQVWDGVGVNPSDRYQLGEGTNGATPLAWTHAEYMKLLRSVSDGRVWDYYPEVGKRYAD